MKINKKVIGKLQKCYSIAPLRYQGRDHILVAAEKQDPCCLFDTDGNLEDTVWEGPGGVMTMVQVPGTDGQFLATQRFYSPNDSKEAKLVIVTPGQEGGWKVRTLAELPFVHRFDIITRNGVRYLIACALKSGHEFRDDWSMPGKVFAAVLPEDLSGFDEEHPLEMTVIKDGLTKNHGYCRLDLEGIECSLVCSNEGVFLFLPPEHPEGKWDVSQLLDTPASDAVWLDLDGDKERELVIITPFHGKDIIFYKKTEGSYREIYRYEEPAEFSHSIYGGTLMGRPVVIIGHRQGKRNLIAFFYDKEAGRFTHEYIDRDCGSANIYHFMKGGKDVIVSTNREIDEIAMYTIE